MDESWRMRMGMPSLAGRRRASVDMTSWTTPADSGRIRGSDAGAGLEADDFIDVFGGPPRSVLSRKMSCDLANNDYFYHEIFRRPEVSTKSNSSSISIQLGILEEDVAHDSFASKLRAINVPCRWNSSSSNPCLSQQFPSPEEEIEYSTTVGISVDEIGELESPSSNAKFKFNASYEEDEEEDDDFSSYVIEIDSTRRREEARNEDADIDEAIAWAKGTFQGSSSSAGEVGVRDDGHFRFGEERSMIPLVMEVQENVSQRCPLVTLYMQEGMHKQEDSSGEHLGTSELDERVDSWASEKHTNIRLLLSTLHHILWPSSGWNATPLPSLIEYSQVKKAYQKARLCIHPDKLQQRSATFVQKYIAQKAFSVLQNAWDAFISPEVYFS